MPEPRVAWLAIVGIAAFVEASAQSRGNAMPNADMKQAAKGWPVGWACNRKDGTNQRYGTYRFLRDRRAIMVEKTRPHGYLPYLTTPSCKLESGRTYLFTARVEADSPLRLRTDFRTPEFKSRTYNDNIPVRVRDGVLTAIFDVPYRLDTVRLSINICNDTGKFTISEPCVKRIPSAASTLAWPPGPAPLHRLSALRERTLPKPFKKVLGPDGTLPGQRVVFKDTATGATIWRMAWGPGWDRHQYSNMTPWNCDGSLLAIRRQEPESGTWLMDARGDAGRFLLNRLAVWSHDSRWHFYHNTKQGGLFRYDVRTHKADKVWDGPGGSFYQLSHDGRKALIVTGAYSRHAKTSVAQIVDVTTGECTSFDMGTVAHQSWFTKERSYAVAYNSERANPKAYKKGHFYARPDGSGKRKLYRKHFSHVGWSPAGTRAAFMSAGISVFHLADNKVERLWRCPSQHLSWTVTDRWLVASVDKFMTVLAMDGAGYCHRICFGGSFIGGYGNYGSEEHLQSSPDGTKICYASNMLGDVDFYVCVQRLPAPPQRLRIQGLEARALLQWDPPDRSAEIAGYLVYQSRESGRRFKLLAPKPVQGTTFEVTDVDAFYCASALEHSGLESGLSNEVSLAGKGPRRLYAEAEFAEMTGGAVPAFLPSFSNLYGVRFGHRLERGDATIGLEVPLAGEYCLWLRVQGCRTGDRLVASVGNAAEATLSLDPGRLVWKKFGKRPTAIARGRVHIRLASESLGALVDRLLLTNDESFVPTRPGPEDQQAPPKVDGLTAVEVGRNHVRLRWQKSTAADVDHYDVYAARGELVRPVQEFLVASPTGPQVTDWGLQRLSTYQYIVCAVDRRGNVGIPSAAASVTTKGPKAALCDAARSFDADTHRLTFDVAGAGMQFVWVEMQITQGQGVKPLQVTRDGKQTPDWTPNFHIICRGKTRTAPRVWFWSLLDLGTPLPPGHHTLALTPAKGFRVEIRRAVLTDDEGFEPKGRTRFQP